MHRPGRRQSLLLHVFARLVAASLAAIGALVLIGPGLALIAPDAGAAAPARDVPSLAEIDGLRTETSRTFAAGGTRVAKLYASPVNFQDGDGTWRPIDNDLVPAAGGFENQANDYKVEIPHSLASKPVTVRDGDVWASFALEGVRAGVGAQIRGSTAQYADVLPGVDAHYSAETESVKEELILEGPSAPTTYRYRLEASPGLEARQNGAGGISLVDSKGATRLVFEPPFMFDSSGTTQGYSDKVSLKLAGEPGATRMVMTADEGWLSSPARRWPVTIDPTLTVNPTKQCKLQSNSTVAACARTFFEVGNTTTAEYREIFQFDVSSIPANAYVLSARFGVLIGDGGGGSAPIDLHALTRAWTTAATWARYDGANSWTTPGGDFSSTVEASHPNPATALSGWDYWYPRDLVQRWVDGRTPNNGLIMRKRGGTATVLVGDWYGSATGTVANRPQLVVEYVQDLTNPVVNNVTHSGLGAFNRGDAALSATVAASDAGSGIKSFALRFPAGPDTTAVRTCDGTSANPCAASDQQLLNYTTNATNFPNEGRSTVSATVKDVVGRQSAPFTWPVGVDRSPPVISTAGSTLNQGGEALDGSSYTLKLKATDGARTSDLTKRSGVVRLQIETRQMTRIGDSLFSPPPGYTTRYDSQTDGADPCTHADASCEMSYDWITAPTDYDPSGGEYIVKVIATDAVGYSSEKKFSIIVPPRTTITDSADFIGLEDWWQYETVETGAGSKAHVNVANGNLVWNFMPITNRGRGLSTVVNLTYNSFVPKPKPLVETPAEDVAGYNQLGPGFSLGISGLTRVNERLNVDLAATGRITLTDRDGTRHHFKGETGNQVFKPPPGVQLHLRRFSKAKTIVEPVLGFGQLDNNDKAWAATEPDGVTHYFDRRGYQTSVEDRNDNKLAYVYEYRSATYQACEAAAGSSIFVLPETLCPRKLVTVTDPAGRPLRLRYNAKAGEIADDGAPGVRPTASGTLKEVIDHAGRVTKFTYSPDGLLTQVQQAFGSADQRQFDFTWEATGTYRGITEITEPGHGSPAGRSKTVIGYEPTGIGTELLFSKRVDWIKDRNESGGSLYSRDFLYASPSPGRTRVRDSLNRVSEYALDARGRPTEGIDARGTKTLVAWDDATTNDNNFAQITAAAGTPDQALTKYAWNPNGMLLTSEDGNSHVTTLTYANSDGYSAHQSPRIVSGGTASIDAGRGFVSDLSTSKRPSGATTSYSYDPPVDGRGNVRFVNNTVGGVFEIRYGSFGLVTSTHDEVGSPPTQFANYDDNGLPRTITDPRGKVWRNCYDERGNLTRATDPRGLMHTCAAGNQQFSTELSYDRLDRLVRETTPKLSGAGQYITRWSEYDPNGNLSRRQDGADRIWTRSYTPMDDVASEQAPSTAHIEGAGAEVTSYSYDSEENLVKRESPRGTRTATVDDFATKYSYDAVDELVAEHRLGNAQAWAARSFAYDRRGNVVGVADPNHNLDNEDFAANAQLNSKRRFTYEYDKADNRTAVVEDPSGLVLRTAFAYDLNDNLISETDPRGTATPTAGDFTATREYDAQDLPTATVDALGRRTEITRRNDGRAVKITAPKGVASAFAGDYETSFQYEPTGELKSRTVPFDQRQYGSKSLSITYARNEVGDPATITDARGKQFTNTFLDSGELLTTTRPSWWAADASGLRERSPEETAGSGQAPDLPSTEGGGDFGTVRRQETDLLPRAGTTSFGYDGELRLTTVTDQSNKTVTLTRDAVGRVSGMHRPIDATRQMSESYVYDFNGNLARVTDAEGHVTSLGYDALDRRDVHNDPNRVAEYHYDRNSNLTGVDVLPGHWDWTYDALDRRVTQTDGARKVTSWAYDAAGNPTVETSPRGMEKPAAERPPFQTRHDYNAANELSKITNGLGHEWRFEYDRNGNQTKVDAPGSARGPGDPEIRQVTERTFDGRDLIWTETTGASGNGPDMLRTRVFEFDPNGLLRRVVRPAGVDPATRLPNFTYASDPEVTTGPDAAKNATVYEYGAPDPTLRTSTRLAWNTDDGAKRYRQDFGYDALGRLDKIDAPYDGAAGAAPAAARTAYTYLDTGWPKTATDNWQTLTYDYDRRGLQTLWESNKGRKITRTYWPSGMPKSRLGEVRPATTWTTKHNYTYTERPGYLLAKMVDVRTGGNRETTFDYDGMGREVKVDEASFNLADQTRRGKDSKLTYDADGNVTERLTDGRFQTDGSYTGGKRTTSTYDSIDQETEILVAAPSEATRRTLTDYWPSGERKSRTTKRSTAADDTVERTFSFSDGRLSRKDRKREGAAVFAKNQAYAYGINGNRITDERGSYLFNAREQVTRWTRPSGVVTDYGLNGSGAVLTQATTAQPTITYEYEPDGQRLKAAVSSGVRTVYAYDAFGSMTGYAVEGQTPPLMWEHDEFGRMIKSNRGGIQTTYTYDGLDRRDTKIEAGRTFDLSYVGASEALSQEQEFGGQGEFRSYDYTGGGLERLGTARKTSATPTAPYRAYSTDAAGSVEGLEDDQGNLLGAAYTYDPYGTQLNSESALAADARENPFRFEGHYYDSAAKSYDMRARSYLPELGRFLGEDRYEDPPADQALESDALTQDRYLFAGGNPVDNIEFDGHEPITTYNPRGRQKMVDRSGSCYRDCDGDDFKGSVSPPATRGTNTYAQWEGQRTPSGQHTFRRSTRPNVAPPPAGPQRNAAYPPSCPGCGDKETNRNPFGGLNDALHGLEVGITWYVGNPGESWVDRIALIPIPGAGIVGKGVRGGQAGIDLLKGADAAAGAARGGSTIVANKARGDAAAAAVARQFPGSRAAPTLQTPRGARRLDFVAPGGRGFEVKQGYTSYSARIREQVARDAELLRSGQVQSIEWQFVRSPVTGRVGPSGPLRDALDRAGIRYGRG